MSGLATIGTIAALVGAGTAAAGTIFSAVNGAKQNTAQKKSLAAQTQAQQEAQAASLSTERQSAVAQNAANQQTPNVAAILARAQTMGNNGLSSTMLTGPSGVSGSSLNLGKTTLLGS